MANKEPYQKDTSFDPLTFLGFWIVMSEGIGNNRLELNPKAKAIDEMFLSDNLYQEHIKLLIQNTLNDKSKSLKQPIDINQVLDALGETAYSLRQNQADDLYEIELLEEIAWHINEKYGHLVKPCSEYTKLESDWNNKTQEVAVISNFRRKTDKRNFQLD
ncbi:MAG: hypothetical protein MK188_02570 [Gammaproteobacteria bacterium]|nr:hypothetical protein [Gammaproteobacteria bacterium]